MHRTFFSLERYLLSAGRGFGAPSVMNNLAIPKFNADNKIHVKLAELSEEAHHLVEKGKPVEDVAIRE